VEVWLNGNVTIHGCMVLVCNQLRGPTEHSTITGMGNKHQPSGSGSALAGKEIMGLASHWPCVTDSVVYLPTGSMASEGWLVGV